MQCREGWLLGETICLNCRADEYISGDQCVDCGLNCAECHNGPNQCKVCAAGSELQSDGTCACESGRYFDKTIKACVQCHSSCETCLGPDKCASCPPGQLLGDTICLSCASDEYVVGDQCTKCGQNCKECISGPNQCLSCVANSDLQVGGSCQCKDGYFYDSSASRCERCSETCATCDSASQCKTCPAGLKLGAGGQCQCLFGSYLEAETSQCLTCPDSCELCISADKCTFCKEGFALSSDLKCLEIQEKDITVPVEEEVVCRRGQFEKDGKCASCSANCLTCFSENLCLECNASSALEHTGACLCKNGFFAELDGTCSNCDRDCLTCSQAGTCSTCESPAILGTKRCLDCPSTSFIDNDQCVTCDSRLPHCSQCAITLDKLSCQTCQEGFIQTITGECGCPEGKFYDTTQEICQACPDTCSSCSSANQCTACKSPLDIVQNGVCQPRICADGTYLSTSGLCQSCSSNCATCDGNSLKCTSCKADHVIADDDTCVRCAIGIDPSYPDACLCPDGSYYDILQKSCRACKSQSCQTCGLNGSDCLICKRNFILSQETRQCSCQSSGYYLQNEAACSACPLGCQDCTSSENCGTCLSGFFASTVIDSFASVDRTQCIGCARGCQKCSDIAKCETCQLSFTLSPADQVCRCPSGTFYEEKIDSCAACTLQNCANCLDRDICIECKAGFEAAFNGRICKIISEKTDSDVSADDDSRRDYDDSYRNGNGLVTKQIDESAVLFKTMGISVGCVVAILLVFSICTCCYRIHKKKNKAKMTVADFVKSQRVTYDEGSDFLQDNDLYLESHSMEKSARSHRQQSLRGAYRTTTNAHTALEGSLHEHWPPLSHISARVPPLDWRRENLAAGNLNTVNEGIAEDSSDEMESVERRVKRLSRGGNQKVYRSRGSMMEQSRFESSPGRSRSDQNSKMGQSGKNMIEMAMTIMGDCEIEMTAEAKQKLNALTIEQSADKGHVLEQIIRVMANTVKEQVEQAQATAAARPQIESLDTMQVPGPFVSRVRSAQARRQIQRIVGATADISQRAVLAVPLDERAIERNLANRFDEMSRGVFDDNHKDRFEQNSRPNLLDSGNFSQLREPVGEYFAGMPADQSHDILGVKRQKSGINSVHNEPLFSSKGGYLSRKKSSSFVQTMGSLSIKKETLGQRARISDKVSEQRSIRSREQSSVMSVKIDDQVSKIMDENDTYRVFVNDDPVSTKKAIENRLEQLSRQHTPRKSPKSTPKGERYETANFPLNTSGNGNVPIKPRDEPAKVEMPWADDSQLVKQHVDDTSPGIRKNIPSMATTLGAANRSQEHISFDANQSIVTKNETVKLPMNHAAAPDEQESSILRSSQDSITSMPGILVVESAPTIPDDATVPNVLAYTNELMAPKPESNGPSDYVSVPASAILIKDPDSQGGGAISVSGTSLINDSQLLAAIVEESKRQPVHIQRDSNPYEPEMVTDNGDESKINAESHRLLTSKFKKFVGKKQLQSHTTAGGRSARNNSQEVYTVSKSSIGQNSRDKSDKSKGMRGRSMPSKHKPTSSPPVRKGTQVEMVNMRKLREAQRAVGAIGNVLANRSMPVNDRDSPVHKVAGQKSSVSKKNIDSPIESDQVQAVKMIDAMRLTQSTNMRGGSRKPKLVVDQGGDEKCPVMKEKLYLSNELNQKIRGKAAGSKQSKKK